MMMMIMMMIWLDWTSLPFWTKYVPILYIQNLLFVSICYSDFVQICLDSQKFRIPQSTSQWKGWLFSFLHEKMRLPGWYWCEIWLLRGRDYFVDHNCFPINVDRYAVDGNFLYQSEGMGDDNSLVCTCTCCSQMGCGTNLCECSRFLMFSILQI